MERQRLWWAIAAAAFLVGLPCGAHSASITVDGTNCTLAEAITSANNDNAAGNGCVDGSGADTITLAADVTLAADLPQITSTITIEGGGHFISGNNARRVLYVASSGNLTLNEAIVKDGRVSSDSYADSFSDFCGGGIYNEATVTLTNSTVSGNTVSSYNNSYGGGICSLDDREYGTLTLTNSTVSGNTVSSSFESSGGGVYHGGRMRLTLNNSTVSNNTAISSAGTSSVALSSGGGISGGTITLMNSTVSGNRALSSALVDSGALSSGGGIYGGTVTLMNSTVSGNSASASYDNDFMTVMGNASSRGGGISDSTVTLTNSTVSGNWASASNGFSFNPDLSSSSSGGGIYGSTVTLMNSTVSGNGASSASSRGGGISDSTVTLTNSTVSGNTASSSYSSSTGGGISDSTVTLTNSTVSRNTASSSYSTGSTGGGIYGSGRTITLRSSIVSGNAAPIGKEVYRSGGTINAASFNLFGHSGETSALAFFGFTPGSSDVVATSNGTTPTALSAILNTTLANNGGPTKTHALPAGSPAVNLDATCSTSLTTDQRGIARPATGCDAGAFEAFVLPASTWRMTAPPCTPVPSGIGSQYGSDIPGGVYGTNWVSYKWNTATQSYGSAQAATDALVQGTGNWLYSTVPATLTVTGTATPTVPCSNYGSGLSGNCFAINLTPSSTARWQIVGHPFPYAVSWADVRVATYNGSAWTQRTPTQAKDANIMTKEMWRWSGSSYQPKDDNVAGGMLGTLLPQEAVWVRMLTGSSAFSTGNIKLLVPAR